MRFTKENELLNFEEACSFLKIVAKKYDYNEAMDKLNELFANEESELYSKVKMEVFLANHISFADAIHELGKLQMSVNNSNFKRTIKNLTMDSIKFSRYVEGQFISNGDFEILKHYYMKKWNHPDSVLYTKQELSEELNLTTELLNRVLDSYDIRPFVFVPNGKGKNYYHEKTLMFLKTEQERKISMTSKSYMAMEDVSKIHDVHHNALKSFIRDNGLNKQLVTPPLIVCTTNITSFRVGKRLVPKHIITQYVQIVKERQAIQDILIDSEVKPYHVYQKILECLNIKFTKESSLTEYYWNSFVRIKLQETIRSGNALQEFISMMVSITKVLVELTSHREIFSFTEKEISLALFKDHIPNIWQRQLYNFFNRFNSSAKSSGVKVINMELIPNPKDKVTVRKEKETYSVQEYLDLIDHCNNPLHTKKAISDAKFQISGKSFKSYSSMWLYTIINLNNAWRHSDVISFPRLAIPQFDHITFEWLENNELSLEDAELIADFYRNQHYIHSKNKQNRYFIISEELLLAFANAVLICELVYREIYPLSDRIIGFQNRQNRPSKGVHNEFFENYESPSEDFEFKSSIINRTVISLATDVISKLSNNNTIDAIKFFRNHSNVEIANIYIDIPQEYVNYIADQLFDIGNFGYIYDNLSLLLFGESTNREDRTVNALTVKKALGSIERVESIAHCALAIASEREQVKEFLMTLTSEERLEKYNLLNLGLLPSKSFDAQCLVGIDNCPMGTRDCDKCSLMIPNRFTLCNLNVKINDKINDFANIYENTSLEGEKIKVSNQLYMSLELVKQAIETFGRDTVGHFVDIDSINESLKSLPSFKQHVTLIEQEEVV
ncbi:TPA: hypothetical protein ACLE2C_003577 [Bacillus paranthracis]|uniref:hypothetical protein n=1 Tax=Bacillus paranthracis TaxID=2026186 RepID=UPI00254C48DB|nr:hypothetical protein [Bacillus paranthracis]MDK7475178.1 hypothetical protein [Bacillus paranthracis]BCC18526.1 hypothetical protein BCM0075_3296 [Bacillus cereus]